MGNKLKARTKRHDSCEETLIQPESNPVFHKEVGWSTSNSSKRGLHTHFSSSWEDFWQPPLLLFIFPEETWSPLTPGEIRSDDFA